MSRAALSRLDAWRGGYDAVLGSAGRLDEQVIWVLDKLAANWPWPGGMAVVDQEVAAGEEAAISKLENLGEMFCGLAEIGRQRRAS